MTRRPPESSSSPFVAHYTVLLVLVGLLAAALVWVEFGVIRELEAADQSWMATVVRLDQVVATLLAPAALLTAFARRRRWPVARRLTCIISTFLVIVVPIGTVMFVYWFFWLRKREG